MSVARRGRNRRNHAREVERAPTLSLPCLPLPPAARAADIPRAVPPALLPLIAACASGARDEVARLWTSGEGGALAARRAARALTRDDTCHPLLTAVHHLRVDVVAWLLEQGVDPRQRGACARARAHVRARRGCGWRARAAPPLRSLQPPPLAPRPAPAQARCTRTPATASLWPSCKVRAGAARARAPRGSRRPATPAPSSPACAPLACSRAGISPIELSQKMLFMHARKSKRRDALIDVQKLISSVREREGGREGGSARASAL